MNSRSLGGLIRIAFYAAIIGYFAFAAADTEADFVPRGTIPPEAYRYRSTLIREARFVWGLNAPTATFSAQIESESGWQLRARNPSGAAGLGQFLGATARHMSKHYPELGPAAPLNPQWALRALMRYNYANYRLAGNSELTCSQAKRMLASFNAGPGVLKRKSWPRETQKYVARIISLEPAYVANGFGPAACAKP
jgi:soluble lytic murein transglycosylase-like protein